MQAYEITILNLTHALEYFMTRLVGMNGHQKDTYYNWIGLWAPNTIIKINKYKNKKNLDSTVNMIGRVYGKENLHVDFSFYFLHPNFDSQT